ncbi:MAG TPA: PadR family transcriptional regulator [Acidimicrobiales bacterium]|nr:PadR family transcriptional regulator [Acidimicrobiales bacterium]
MPAAPPVEPTSTGHTLLGLLSFGRELSGYELKQWADNLRFFWSAPAMSQVYRELERLAAGGLVEQRLVVREGSRTTKVYRLSARGREVVRAWLASPPGPPVLRHPVALRVFFGHLLDAEELRAAVVAHREWCDRMLADLAALRANLGEDGLWRNAALVADWGLDYYRGEIAAADGIEAAVVAGGAAVSGAGAGEEPEGPAGEAGEAPDGVPA